jgi:hypothetical protein
MTAIDRLEAYPTFFWHSGAHFWSYNRYQSSQPDDGDGFSDQ